jgi:hypothetical protein
MQGKSVRLMETAGDFRMAAIADRQLSLVD